MQRLLGGTIKPCYQTHSAGWRFLLLVIAFFGVEIIQFFRQGGWRKDAIRVATPAFWVGVVVGTVVATVMLHRGSRLAPGASMGNGALVFIVGMVLLTPSAALRRLSFWAFRAPSRDVCTYARRRAYTRPPAPPARNPQSASSVD